MQLLDAYRQGDKARFKRLDCGEHKAERKTSVCSVHGVYPRLVLTRLSAGGS
jgi:hypothetical protein